MWKSRSLFLVISVVLVSFAAGYWFHRPPGSKPAAGGRRVLYYIDPMHPAYKSEKPGVAPDCGMKLEPVYAEASQQSQLPQDNPSSLPPGSVQISTEKQQMIGVQLATVERTSGGHSLRTTGRVVADENRTTRVVAAAEGWIRSVEPIVAGYTVHKDEVLATFYNRDFLTAQQTYFRALTTYRPAKDDSAEQLKFSSSQVQAAEENLEYLGMGETQIHEIARTRQIAKNIELRAPIAGMVLARSAYAGQRFDRGAELYRIADISHVWVLADLYENEARSVRPGAAARVVSPGLGKTFPAKLSDSLPQFDGNSRTLKVRLEMENPGNALRPDMFVDIELPAQYPSGISVPADAILDSGTEKTVFVARGNGYFEPRLVETGWRYGDRVEIVKGLKTGEQIVTSGNFLIDSESRMKLTSPAAVDNGAPAKAGARKFTDPACGMEVEASQAAGRKTDYGGKTYYFCSDHCKRQFDQDPQRYVAMTPAGRAGQHD